MGKNLIEAMARYDRYKPYGDIQTWFDTRIDGLIPRIKGLIPRIHGLGIDKSTAFQTICQTTKYQTIIFNIGGISPYRVYTPYHRYKGLSISSISRPKMAGTPKKAGNREDTHNPLYKTYKPYIPWFGHIEDMKV